MTVQLRCTYPDFERAYRWADVTGVVRHDKDELIWWQVRYPDGAEFELPIGRFLWTYDFRDDK
jgi:hypothetical protein